MKEFKDLLVKNKKLKNRKIGISSKTDKKRCEKRQEEKKRVG